MFLFLMAKNQTAAAGMCLGIAALLKMSPAILLLPLLYFQQWRVVASAAALVAAFGFALYISPIPFASYASFFDAFSQVSSGNLTLRFEDNLSIERALSQIFGMGVWDFRVALKVLLLLLGLLSLRCFTTGIRGQLRAYSAFMVLMILLSPTVWFQHLLWTAPAIYILVFSLQYEGERRLRILTRYMALFFAVSQIQLIRYQIRNLVPDMFPFATILPALLLLWLFWEMLHVEKVARYSVVPQPDS
jgi:hypothetical protein